MVTERQRLLIKKHVKRIKESLDDENLDQVKQRTGDLYDYLEDEGLIDRYE